MMIMMMDDENRPQGTKKLLNYNVGYRCQTLAGIHLIDVYYGQANDCAVCSLCVAATALFLLQLFNAVVMKINVLSICSGMLRYRYLATSMATTFTCSKETVVCSDDIRKSLRKHLP